MQVIRLPFVDALRSSLADASPLIQVVLGPRQVGKTTGVRQLMDEWSEGQVHFASADGEIARPGDWVEGQWETARSVNADLLVVDEIQKVENWSERVKALWEEQYGAKAKLKVVLLGSSSLSLQRGLRESLAGRYEVHRVFHWNPIESRESYGISSAEFLLFGGYPGSYRFVDDRTRWVSYVRDSIIDAVIGRDILSLVRVKSAALFRQCFEIATSYAAQEISYTKLLGQLQDKGNTDLVKQYLDHFEGAFLLKQLQKYSNKATLRRSSSPKIVPMCPALYSVELDADLGPEERGRSFEVMVGAALSRFPGKLFYWRERSFEVDYVYKYGKRLVAIEVKSGRKKSSRGLRKFREKFPQAETLIITPQNVGRLFGVADLFS